MAALPDPGAEPDPDPQPAKTLTPEQEEQAIIVQYELLWKLTDQLAQSMLSDDCAYIHPAWASRNVYAWRAEYFGPEVAAADWADARQRGDWHKRIWDENGVIVPPTPPGQIPDHMRSAFDHYGPRRKRRSPEGAVDEL